MTMNMSSRQGPAHTPMTLGEKKETVEILSVVVAMIVTPIMRHGMGYQRAKVGLLLFVFAVLGVSDLIWPSIPLLVLAVVTLVRGSWQNHQSRRAVRRGELAGDTRSNGLSWLRLLPIPGWLTREERVERFLDPLVCFGAGMAIFTGLDHETGVWVIAAAMCLRIRERYEYAYRDNLRAERHNAMITSYDGLVHMHQMQAGSGPQRLPARAADNYALPTGGPDDQA